MNTFIIYTILHHSKCHNMIKSYSSLFTYISVNKTKAKWKNLRDSYRLQLYKQIDALENNTTTNVETSWPFYNEMSFLQDHMYRKTLSKNVTNFESEGIIGTDDLSKLTDGDSIRHIEMVTVDEFDSSVLDYLNQSDSSPNACKKTKTSIVVHSNRSSVETAEDEDRCFFDSLLPYMKLLSPKDKMLCRMRIQEVIFSVAFPSGRSTKSCESLADFDIVKL